MEYASSPEIIQLILKFRQNINVYGLKAIPKNNFNKIWRQLII